MAEKFRTYWKLYEQNNFLNKILANEEYELLVEEGIIDQVDLSEERSNIKKLNDEKKKLIEVKEEIEKDFKLINSNEYEKKENFQISSVVSKMQEKYFNDENDLEPDFMEEEMQENEIHQTYKAKNNINNINISGNVKTQNDDLLYSKELSIKEKLAEYKKRKESLEKARKARKQNDKEKEIVYEDELDKIKANLEAKSENIKKKLAKLLDESDESKKEEIYKTFNNEKEKEFLKEEINPELLKYDNIDLEELKKKRYEEKVNNLLESNFSKIKEIVEDVSKWKEVLIRGIKYEFIQTINYIENEKKENIRSANISEEEKQLYTKTSKSMKNNKEKAEELIYNIEKLIKLQQKFAKIAADCNSNYTAVVDGFTVRDTAVKLSDKLKQIYKEFEEEYYKRIELNKDTEDRLNVKHLEKKLEASEQIGIFLNYLFNPTTAKPGTQINRFDELILIEENELKRQIYIYATKLIDRANLLILEDEIDYIETKSPINKVIDFITGRKKIDEYFVNKLDETWEQVKQREENGYPIDRNYRIHDIVAEIMIFKSENADDDLVDKEYDRLAELEEVLAKNFSIDTEKVLEEIDKRQDIDLPATLDKPTKEDEIDLEMTEFVKKYGYNSLPEGPTEYKDSTNSEIKQILDYIKIAF